MNNMTENLNNLLHELSEIYDKESQDTYVSVYLNKDFNKKFLDRRRKACESILKEDIKKNFNNSMKEIEDVIQKNRGKNIAIFSSKKHDFIRYTPLNVEIKNLLIVDSSPYLRPLARINDEWESFTLLLLNTNYAKIYSLSLKIQKNSQQIL